MFRSPAIHVGIASLLLANLAAAQARLPSVFREDFSQGAGKWEPLDKEGWRVAKDGEQNATFQQFIKKSSYRPPHRSPFHIALRRGDSVGDFELTARVRSTHPDYGHRDACLFFGFQDAAHFYYVHLGKKTDDHANQIFIVDGAPRIKISTKTTPGTNWDDEWHRVKIVRDTKSGRIQVFFDDMKKPIMEATNRKFLYGRVGVGSFDDTSEWDDIILRGKRRSE